MEDYQEEIEIVEHLYFKARAFVKYRADRHNYLSEEKGFDHFSIETFYDLKIGDAHSNSVQKITEDTYVKNIEKCIPIKKIEGKAELWKDGVCYLFAPDAVFFHPSNPSHNQVEDESLHGYFNDLVLYFKTHRTKKLIICKEGYPTGNTKFDEDGFEYTEKYCRDCSTTWEKITCVQGSPTGKTETRDGKFYVEYYNLNCSTYWKEVPVKIECVQGLPTGNSELRNNIVFIEYYNSDCSTYWKPACQQDKPTGLTKKVDGVTWREYFNHDCSTYWREDIEPVGCADIFMTLLKILAGIFIAIPLILFLAFLIEYKLWIPLLLIAGLILLSRFVIFLIDYSNKYPKITKVIGSFFQFILTLLILGLIGFGIATLFKNNNGSSKSRWENVPPSPEPIFESDTLNSYDSVVRVSVNWMDYKGNLFKGSYTLKKQDIQLSEQNLNNIPVYANNHFGRVYKQLYKNDKEGLSSLFNMLDSIKNANNLSRIEFAEAVVSMIQAQEYVLILEIGCASPMAYNDREIQAMLRSGIKCDGEYLYGVKTPLKFASDLKGDCDTRTLLLYTIFKHFNYDVAILNSEYYKHSILGLNLPNQKGSFKSYQGRKYYFWETTSKGFKLGELPRENRNINFWNVVLN